MSRGLPEPGGLSDEQLRLRETIVAGRASATDPAVIVGRDGALLGPFGPMLLSPAVGDALQHLGAAVRFRSTLPARTRELATLATAVVCGSRFEWETHRPLALEAGLTADQLSDLAAESELRNVAATDVLIVRLTRLLCRGTPITADEFDCAEQTLGSAGLFELVTIVGYYRTLASIMAVYEVDERLLETLPMHAASPRNVPSRQPKGE